MSDIWLGRFSRWFEKLFNAKGGPLLLDVNPSIQAMVQYGSGAEDFYLQGIYRYAQFAGVSAVAGQQATGQLRNPKGSNVVITVELIGIGPSVPTVSTYHVSQGPSTGEFATVAPGFRLDARTNQNSSGLFSSGNQAAADLSQIILLTSGSNANAMIAVNFGVQLPILPGDAIRVTDQTVNEAFTFEMVWRERALESSELT